jgi:outer membrane protein insertion porin family
MIPPRVILVALIAASSVVFAAPHAEAQRGTVFTAAHITFRNPGDFTQGDLETAAGLHEGDRFKADDLTTAAQRLSDTGYFDTVSAGLGGGGSSVPVIFVLKPFDHAQMLHAGFENFIWLTDAETAAAIHATVPLFHGYLPEGDSQADAIDSALMKALAAKGVTATVKHETVEPTLAHPERIVEFRVTNPAVTVSNVKLSGVSSDLIPYLQKSVNGTAHKEYNDGLSGEQTSTLILEPLLDAGYVEAGLSNTVLTPTTAADGDVGVVISAALNAGAVYRIGKIIFAGSALMTAEAFAASETLHPGDVASRKALMETLTPLDTAYRHKGYMDVIVSAIPTLEKAALTVDYSVSVKPGEPYRIHEVTADGLPPDARADYDRGFLLKAGDLYDPEYVRDFLKNNTALVKLNGYSANFIAVADPVAHTVDLSITFYRVGR